jgi:hypothetical protein
VNTPSLVVPLGLCFLLARCSAQSCSQDQYSSGITSDDVSSGGSDPEETVPGAIDPGTGNGTHTIRFVVRSNGSKASITSDSTDNGKFSQHQATSARLPWSKTVSVIANYAVRTNDVLLAQNIGGGTAISSDIR